MIKTIKVLALAALLIGAAAPKVSAQTYYERTLTGNPTNTLTGGLQLTNVQQVAFVDATYNTNVFNATVYGLPTNVFKINAGQPVSITCIQVATNASTANVVYTLKTTTDEFVTPRTRWSTANNISWAFALNGTNEVVGQTNLVYSLFGGARHAAFAQVTNLHTATIWVSVKKGSY